MAGSVRATDLYGLKATETFVLEVTVPRYPPVVPSKAVAGSVGKAISLKVTATDGYKDVLRFSLTARRTG